jgi:hypothetical protein
MVAQVEGRTVGLGRKGLFIGRSLGVNLHNKIKIVDIRQSRRTDKAIVSISAL